MAIFWGVPTLIGFLVTIYHEEAFAALVKFEEFFKYNFLQGIAILMMVYFVYLPIGGN